MKSIRYMPSLEITRLFFDKPGFSARWRSDVQIALLVRRQTLWNHLTLFLSDTFLPVTYPV